MYNNNKGKKDCEFQVKFQGYQYSEHIQIMAKKPKEFKAT